MQELYGFVRLIVLESLRDNVNITTEWVSTGDNGKADALFRMEFDRFRYLGPNMNLEPMALPEDIYMSHTKYLAKKLNLFCRWKTEITEEERQFINFIKNFYKTYAAYHR